MTIYRGPAWPSALRENETVLRSEFPAVNASTYFNHASVAPLHNDVTKAMNEVVAIQSLNPSSAYKFLHAAVAQFRREASTLLDCHPKQVAFTSNATAAINILRSLATARINGEVIALENEFPALLHPWLAEANSATKLRTVKTTGNTAEALIAAVDCNTQAVVVSAVSSLYGEVVDLTPLASYCNDHDVDLYVDASQALGIVPVQLSPGISAVFASGHKSLLGPVGSGLLAVQDEILDRADRNSLGWMSVAEPFSQQAQAPLRDARRWESGTLGAAAVSGFAASLSIINNLDEQQKVAISIADLLCARLRDEDVDARRYPGSPIVTISNQPHLEQQFSSDGIHFTRRGEFIRLAAHHYNASTDVDHLSQSLKRSHKNG